MLIDGEVRCVFVVVVRSGKNQNEMKMEDGGNEMSSRQGQNRFPRGAHASVSFHPALL